MATYATSADDERERRRRQRMALQDTGPQRGGPVADPRRATAPQPRGYGQNVRPVTTGERPAYRGGASVQRLGGMPSSIPQGMPVSRPMGQGVPTRPQVMPAQQPLMGNAYRGSAQPQARRYGQQQGYRTPRRQLGGQHYPSWARQQGPGQGYSPRTAGRFGGRPQQMNEMQAMTRPAFTARAYNQQPWGGVRAVPRQMRNY